MKAPSPNARRDGRAIIYAQRNLKAVAARWDARAATWDETLQDPQCHLNEDDAYSRFLQALDRAIARRAAFCAANGIIDVGCGTGLVLERVSAKFEWAIGLDISAKMIRAARAKKLPDTEFIRGDCFDLPSLCPRAGAVVSRGVLLSHYGRAHGELLLAAARESLVTRGFALFDFLNAAARGKFEHVPEDKTFFTGSEIRTLAHRAGFKKAAILGSAARRVLLLLAGA